MLAASDIVVYTLDVTTVSGNWSWVSSATVAGGYKLVSADYGSSNLDAPLAAPVDYLDLSFSASAYTPYHVWLRLRATGDSKYNDSVWVQFSDALDSGGSGIYRIGSSSGLLVNLENCSGCGESAWGWQDKAYWLSQSPIVQFASSGTHTVRVQVREDGVQIDQIVLSPATYMYSAPGALTNDTTILPWSRSASASTATASSTSSSGGGYSSSLAYGGTPASLPGRVEAGNFDTGGSGVSYGDTTSGNTGGAYRSTDVDLEASSEGGYDVGWIAAGEWLNYTVNVGASGTYTAQLRVASPSGGGSLHIGFNGSGVWTTVSIPATGGWQNWTTVNVPMSLSAGVQQMTILFDTAGFNLEYVDVASGTTSSASGGSASSGGGSGGSGSSGGSTSGGSGTVTVYDWNIENIWGAGHAATAMDYAVSVGPMPQVLIVEEMYPSQYGTYISELQNRTGQSWSGVVAPHCAPGAWNGSYCTSYDDEAAAVFTSLPVQDSSTIVLPYADAYHSGRGAARLAVSVNGTTVQVFGTHLQVNADTARYQSMALLKSWASNFSSPQIMGGDFNAGPDQIDTTAGVLPNFIDTWNVVGSGPGYTANAPDPSMKLDYLFGDSAGKASPVWTYVVTGTGSFSDHFGVMTNFNIRP